MSALIAVEEIDWMIGPPADGDYWPELARCECCCETAVQDFSSGREPRQFYRTLDDQLVVCGQCLPGLEDRR